MSALPQVRYCQEPGVIGGLEYVHFQVPENEFRMCCMDPVRLVQMQMGCNSIFSREEKSNCIFMLLHCSAEC